MPPDTPIAASRASPASLRSFVHFISLDRVNFFREETCLDFVRQHGQKLKLGRPLTSLYVSEIESMTTPAWADSWAQRQSGRRQRMQQEP